MGWYQYYRLLDKYKGDLKKATEGELIDAMAQDESNPDSARDYATQRWKDDRKQERVNREKLVKSFRLTG